MAQRRMELRREEKADTRLTDAGAHLFGGEIDINPKGLQHIGATAQRTGGPVAVFGHFHTRASDYESRHRRNVEGIALIAAGSAGVQYRPRAGIDPNHRFSHGARKSQENFGAHLAWRQT